MRLVFLIFLWFPTLAFADPVSVIGLVASGLGGTAFTIGSLAVSWGTIVFSGAMLLYGQSQQRKAQQQQQAQLAQDKANYNAGLQDRQISGVATNWPVRYAYGVVRIGGGVFAMFTTGDRDEYRHLIVIFAQQQSQSFDEFYINKKPLGPLDSSGNVTSGDFYISETKPYSQEFAAVPFTLTTTPNPGTLSVQAQISNEYGGFSYVPVAYTIEGNVITSVLGGGGIFLASYQGTTGTPMVRVIKHLGVPGDIADAVLQSEVGGLLWPNTAVLAGHTYAYFRLNLNFAEFQSGLPAFEALMHGKLIYDPRTGFTVYSDNNALVGLDYVTSDIGGVEEEDVPEEQFIAAANDCDDIISTVGGESGWTGKRYTFNGVITADEGREVVLDRIADSMMGGIVETTWDVYAGKYTAPVMDLTEKDVIGEIAAAPGSALNEVFNTVVGRYVGADNNYVDGDYKPYVNFDYKTADGRELKKDIDWPYTDSQQRVRNLCRIMVEDNRNDFAVNGHFSRKAWKLRVGQRVRLTYPFFGIDAKVFRITDKAYAPGQAVMLGLKEDAETIWDTGDAIVVEDTPNTGLSNPFNVPKLVSVTLVSGDATLVTALSGDLQPRIKATWPQSTSVNILTRGVIEIQYLLLGETVWQSVPKVLGSDTSAYIAPVIEDSQYTVRIRAVNPYINAESDWTYSALHTVVGKKERPPDIETLNIAGAVLSWPGVVARDLAGYVFRFQYLNNLDWNTATPLHTGVITASPFDLVTRPGGVVTVMGKSVDTSGNEAENVAAVILNLGDPVVANVVETIDLKALGFPGTHPNATLISGVLTATASDSFYSDDDQSLYEADNDPFYPASSYFSLVYTSDYIAINSALVDSIMTLLITSTGTDLTIEYERSGAESMYGIDGDSFYGPDADSFYDAPSPWLPWPGQVVAQNGQYRFRITLGAGASQASISLLKVIIDAPDIIEYVNDIAISAAGTIVPFTSHFTVIKTVTPSLQINGSGAETVEVDKTINLQPKIRAYNNVHTAVSGATADVILKGY